MLKNIMILALASLFVITFCNQKPYKGPSQADVIVLQPGNFEDTVYSSTDPWLIELYAPWCGHCVSLRPQWAKAATKLKGVIKFAKIDPSDNAFRPKFHKMFGLVGFPRIVMIPAGVKSQAVYDVYEGAREASSIEEWARQKLKTHKALAVERITSQKIWQQNCIEAGASLCIVALLPTLLDSSNQERSVYLEIIRTVTNSFRDKPVGFLWAEAGNHPQFQTLFNLNSGFPAVVLINPERRVFTTMKSSLTQENLQQWLQELFRSKGGRRFSRFSKQITFSTIGTTQESKDDSFGTDEL